MRYAEVECSIRRDARSKGNVFTFNRSRSMTFEDKKKKWLPGAIVKLNKWPRYIIKDGSQIVCKLKGGSPEDRCFLVISRFTPAKRTNMLFSKHECIFLLHEGTIYVSSIQWITGIAPPPTIVNSAQKLEWVRNERS